MSLSVLKGPQTYQSQQIFVLLVTYETKEEPKRERDWCLPWARVHLGKWGGKDLKFIKWLMQKVVSKTGPLFLIQRP